MFIWLVVLSILIKKTYYLKIEIQFNHYENLKYEAKSSLLSPTLCTSHKMLSLSAVLVKKSSHPVFSSEIKIQTLKLFQLGLRGKHLLLLRLTSQESA